MSIDNDDVKYRQQASNRKKMVAVYQFCFKTGKFIAEHASVRDAERATGIKGSDISLCYRGLIKHAGKCIWVRKDSYEGGLKDDEY